MDQDIIEELGDYKIIKVLGRGSFGTVYEAERKDNRSIYAIKAENMHAHPDQSMLKNEYTVYNEMKGLDGIIDVYYLGVSNDIYYLVMDKLGNSLEQIYEERNRNFSLKTICMIGKRMIDIIKGIHEKGRIYRDIKPENFLLSLDKKNIYLVDLGMTKRYVDLYSGKHIKLEINKKLTGTARYASINTHNGLEQSRRDDLESILYVLIYFSVGSLPWMGIHASTGKEKYQLIGKKKNEISPETLCKGIRGSKYFIKCLKYIRSIEFEEKPDYDRINFYFDSLMTSKNLENDGIYDWLVGYTEYETLNMYEDKKDVEICNIQGENNRNKKKKKGFWKKLKSFISECGSSNHSS
ncbi:serine/threonine protein kinase [Hamiltosporidium magnivora]|uniref:Serine/threonine protein kinase n=1 Tax=Hamiltosporidium magnivora TaxID=148818 RepID=A0A4Q9L3Z3_9MICR|nr:Palmitoylated plasma membrane-bound casein kinase [Hamiltosporidium tvaerminnensis]TBU01805.1 serine/threonine protein kinase [Hamiltosporidium magnivora]